MEIKIHDSGVGRDEDRFTAHAAMRADVASVSAVEVDIEAYGPTEDAARQRLRDVARELAEELLTLAN